MKYKLGRTYYIVNKSQIESVVFRCVRITIDSHHKYSEEVYYDGKGYTIVTVDNMESQSQDRPVFNSKKRAIDWQIAQLKAMKNEI